MKLKTIVKGEVVFYKSGAMSQKDTQKSFEIIQNALKY